MTIILNFKLELFTERAASILKLAGSVIVIGEEAEVTILESIFKEIISKFLDEDDDIMFE